NNALELAFGTLWNNADTDGDGLNDAIEYQIGTIAVGAAGRDSDNDGISDYVEYTSLSDPTNGDDRQIDPFYIDQLELGDESRSFTLNGEDVQYQPTVRVHFHSGPYTEWINVTGMTELYTLSSHDLSIAQVMPGSVTARITAAGDTKLSVWLTELPVIRDEVLLHVEQAADTGLPDMALTLLDAGYEQAFYRGASKNLVMLEIINNISPIQIRAVRLGGDDIAFDTPFGSDYSLCPQVYEWDHSAAACDTALISMYGIGRVDNSIPMATSMSMEGTYNQPAQDLRLFLFHDADVNWNDDSVAIEIDIMTDAGEYRTLTLDIPIKSD